MPPKNKAKTLQQRFGFQDGDLKTPMHDEIMLWLDANLETITSKIFKDYHKGDVIPGLIEECTREMRDLLGQYQENRTKAWWTETQEAETKEKAEGLKGFIDNLKAAQGCIPRASVDKKTWECPVLRDKYIVGFVDLEARCHATVLEETGYGRGYSFQRLGLIVRFEVKSTIPSLGELVRQIRMYEQYPNTDVWGKHTTHIYVVVCPDNRFAPAIEQQGIKFIQYIPEQD